MTAYQLHDADSEEILGSVIVTLDAKEVEDSGEAISEGWEAYNKLEETEFIEDTKEVNQFVKWFNDNYVTQIERLYIEIIQH